MKMHRVRETSRREAGAAAVEFALVLPVLLLLICGTIDFARAYNAHISLSGAAREGARVLALGTGDPVATTQCAAPSLDTDGDGCGEFAVATNPASCSGNAGQPATVTAAYDFSYITPVSNLMVLFGGSGLASPLTLNGIGVMRCGG